ncbi:hypothetical protein BGX34_000172, partial [Mortierella sp. NVP85]
MIQQDAWNVDAGHDDDNDEENDEENDNEDDISIREDSDAITGNGYSLRSHTENIDITGDSMDGEVRSWGHGPEAMFPLDEELCESGMLVDTAAREVTTAMAVENWRNSIQSSSRLDEDLGNYNLQDNGHDMGPDHEEYNMSTSQGSGQSSDSEDEEEQLPVLTLQVADPEGSCFDELLYWLYTNDSARWRACFTPQNYDSILQNIRILNIFKDDVFKICQDFELSTSPEL